MIGRRDILLEVPKRGDPRLTEPNGPMPAPQSRKWLKRIASGHALLIPAISLGWGYSAYLWPTWLMPIGVTIGNPHPVEGLLEVSSRGQKARLITAGQLTSDWHDWIADDRAPALTPCIALPRAVEQRLESVIAANAHSTRPGQFWVKADLQTRFSPAQCGSDHALHRLDGIKQIDAMTPIHCSRSVFVANGFSCPGPGQSPGTKTALNADDYYPAAALRANEEGKVTVRIERDATGSPTRCTILHSSEHQTLDRQTCKLVGTDPGFTPPARDPTRLGQPIIQSVVWRIPH